MLTHYFNNNMLIFFPLSFTWFRFRQEITVKNENAIQDIQKENTSLEPTKSVDMDQSKKVLTAKDKVAFVYFAQ